MEWEKVWEGEQQHWLDRMEVPGGYLYRYCFRDRRNNNLEVVQIVYVPTPGAMWSHHQHPIDKEELRRIGIIEP